MAEEQATLKAENYEYTASGKYLKSEFTKKAPTDQGINKLVGWLEEEMPNEVKANIAGEMDFWPPILTDLLKKHKPLADQGSIVDTLVVDSLLGCPKRLETMVNEGLWSYVANRSLLSRHEQEQMSGEQPKRPPRFTKEQLRESGKAKRELLEDMGLGQEAAMIDHLFREGKGDETTAAFPHRIDKSSNLTGMPL